MENISIIINTLEKAYMNGQIGGVVSLILNDNSENILWKASVKHDGGIDASKTHEIKQHLHDRINELQWILNNKCPPKTSVKIIVKPSSQAYLEWRNNRYAISQLPRYINAENQSADIRVRNISVINAFEQFLKSNCKNTHINFAIYYKAVKSIMFENNKIHKDIYDIVKIYDKDISC